MAPRAGSGAGGRALGALGLCLLACALAPGSAGAAASDYHHGFVLTGWRADSYARVSTDTGVKRMAEAGSDHAAIFTQWFMDGPTSSHLAPDAERTPTDAAMLHAIELARAAGQAVTVKPQIGIRSGSWIGGAHPADLDAFWADYRTMLLHYADLAEESGAQMLVVGTEMKTLSGQEARWRALVADVRAHFHGRLTYAANYDEYEHVPFWDALDYIGVDAYFALADDDDPAPATDKLAGAWESRGLLNRLAAASRRTGRQVIFTEVGYRGTHTTAVHPNRWDIPDDTDTAAQARAYEAFYSKVATQPWVAGFYWWELNVDSWWVQDYNPLGKGAEQVMATWNRRVPVEAAAEPPAVDAVPGPEQQPVGAPAPVVQPPAPSPSPAPAISTPLSITLSMHGRRLRGKVANRVCTGTIQLRVRKRVHHRWRYVRPPRPMTVRRSTFTRRLPRGKLRVRAVYTSPCGNAASRWVGR